MRFVDSNVFLHALLRPRRELRGEERRVKEAAKAVLRGIEGGEEVLTTTSHVSEVVNIVETGLGLEKSLGVLAWMLTSANVEVASVSGRDYEEALGLAGGARVSVNDALAYLVMKKRAVTEAYSFDRHFDALEDVTRLPKTS